MLGSLLLITATAFLGQNTNGIRGTVVTWQEQPVGRAEVRLSQSNGQGSPRIVRTEPDGRYQLQNLLPDTYDLEVSASGFYSVTIRGVQLGITEVRTLPAVLLNVGLIAECGMDRRPDDYTLAVGGTGTGSVNGVITSEGKTPVVGASVKLYIQTKGSVGATLTDENGSFTFQELSIHSDEYWVIIAGTGYYSEELRHLTIRSGLKAVYAPITLESCAPGRCQPYLKSIRVMPGCA